MTRVEIDLNEDIISILNKLQNINDTGLDLYIPVGAAIFDNILNLKLLRKEMEKTGHVVHFITDDEVGNTLISMLDTDTSTSFMPEDFGNISMSSAGGLLSKIPAILGGLLPKAKVPAINSKALLLIPLVLALCAFGLYKRAGTLRADIKIVVASQSTARSISMKVKKDAESSEELSVLGGKAVSAVLVEKAESTTTGEKLVGEKSEGKVTIFNKTSDEVDLDEGTELNFDDGDEDLVFVLTEDITIPAIYEKDPTDPSSVLVPGEVEADIEASDIGAKFNIDGGETMGVEGYKRSELVAEVVEDLTGGKSETRKIVSEKDKTDLSTSTLSKVTAGAEEALKKNLSVGQKLIEGSSLVSIQKETYSKAVNEEAEKLELVMEVTVSGLTYSEDDLNDLLDKLVAKSMPEEYVISDEGRVVEVDVLGNTDSSILSSVEADLQVTSKTYVVPNISEDDLKDRLKGKSSQEAERIIGSLKDIRSYTVEIRGGIPLFKKVPKDIDKISIEITKSDD
ncbi:MAG: hypothetical protein WC243_01025 [Patescibacteria group bacterium]|jgi:hypothetical protein